MGRQRKKIPESSRCQDVDNQQQNDCRICKIFHFLQSSEDSSWTVKSTQDLPKEPSISGAVSLSPSLFKCALLLWLALHCWIPFPWNKPPGCCCTVSSLLGTLDPLSVWPCTVEEGTWQIPTATSCRVWPGFNLGPMHLYKPLQNNRTKFEFHDDNDGVLH